MHCNGSNRQNAGGATIVTNTTHFTGLPADARYLLGLSQPGSERQHARKLQTLSCTLRGIRLHS